VVEIVPRKLDERLQKEDKMDSERIMIKTDYAIVLIFVVSSVLLSGALWLLPFRVTQALVPVAPVACAVALFVILRRHDRRVDHLARKNDYRQIEAWISLQRFVMPELPISGLRWGAISPDLAGILCKELLIRNPELVVECGAGISTVLAGYILKGLDKGRLITLEHDPSWAERVKSWIIQHNLGDRVMVLYAPLTEHSIEGRKVRWYDIDGIKNYLEGEGIRAIELLFVDGPPESIASDIRRPAVPLLQRWFGRNCIIIVDDTNRPAERRIVQDWCRFLEASSEWIATEKGAAIIRLS
jgi:hypothetical protein